MNKNDEFRKLKKRVNDIEIKANKHISSTRKPTHLELLAGVFKDTLEPQVQDAVFEFYRKGYSAESSGFYGDHGEFQCIEGYFNLDNATKKKLEKMDVKVLDKHELKLPGLSDKYTSIRFWPAVPDLDDIKKEWDKIAKLLPDKRKSASPSISGAAEDFRKKYPLHGDKIQKLAYKKMLDLDTVHPKFIDAIKKKMKEII